MGQVVGLECHLRIGSDLFGNHADGRGNLLNGSGLFRGSLAQGLGSGGNLVGTGGNLVGGISNLFQRFSQGAGDIEQSSFNRAEFTDIIRLQFKGHISLGNLVQNGGNFLNIIFIQI